MRHLTISFLAASALGCVSMAQAADFSDDYLRGPDYEPVSTQIVDWSGFYVGGHGGYTTTNFGFGRAGQSEIAQIVQGLAIEAQYNISTSNRVQDARAHDGSYGGFAGYNWQFDDTVLGIEADYTNLNQKGQASYDVSRSVNLSGGRYDAYSIATQARGVLQDYGTVRVRAGYAIGSFMPFITAGGAFGRALVGTNVRVRIDEYSDAAFTNLVGTLDRTGGSLKEKYRLGFSLGLGAEYLVTQNIFVRGEYQYLQFAKFGDMNVNVNTIRGAVGLKF